MSRGKLHISRSPYHSFYHREETKAQHHSLFRSVVNSQTEMRHSTRLYCLSSLSVLSSPPFFSLGIFCEFIVLWSYETDHMYSNREKGKKEHLMTGSIHFSWQKHLFTSVPYTRNCYYCFCPNFFLSKANINFFGMEQIEKYLTCSFLQEKMLLETWTKIVILITSINWQKILKEQIRLISKN